MLTKCICTYQCIFMSKYIYFFIHIYIDNINLDAADIVGMETEPSTDNET